MFTLAFEELANIQTGNEKNLDFGLGTNTNTIPAFLYSACWVFYFEYGCPWHPMSYVKQYLKRFL